MKSGRRNGPRSWEWRLGIIDDNGLDQVMKYTGEVGRLFRLLASVGYNLVVLFIFALLLSLSTFLLAFYQLEISPPLTSGELVSGVLGKSPGV